MNSSDLHNSLEHVGTMFIKMPDGSLGQFPLRAPTMTIGRSPENDIVLDHTTVSRRHARLVVEGGNYYLEDLGSSNGTYLGDLKLSPDQRTQVAKDQVFEFGHVKASFQPINAAAAVDPRAAPYRPWSRASSALTGFFSGLNPVVRLGLLMAGVTGILALTVVCMVVGLGALLNRGQRDRLTAACELPRMPPSTFGGWLYTLSAVQTAVPGNPELAQELGSSAGPSDAQEPLLSTAFLDLPFPYDGGNENFGGTLEQFRLAIQRNTGTGGRVNSFFDHYLPLYPAPNDPGGPGGKEPAEAPIAKNIVPFDGILNPYYSYSGHPALDFSTFVYRTPTTPVFASADGVIAAVGTHGASGALYVKINHTVADLGVFQTVYWHLHPDAFFDAMLRREGETIHAGDRVGTMGNTGYSTGHHLHFEVRFDLNGDGNFSGSEVIDPFGWIASAQYPNDPWFNRSGIVSNYLWVHPMGSSAQIPPDGGGQVAQPGGTGGEYPVQVCAPAGSLPPGGTVFYSWSPDPEPTDTSVGVGQGCVLSVLDAQGEPVSQFDQPVKIVLPFDTVDLGSIDPETLVIYWLEPGSQVWNPLSTTLDFENRVAIAETDRPGKCSLMGLPTQDNLPPTTEIQVSGMQAGDGAYYDQVQVSLLSSDPSGVSEIFYSLDNGTTWLLYTEPFSLQPGPIPEPVEMDEQFFGGLPGTFLILASAVDTQGNVEDPPRMTYFSIDSSKNPARPGTGSSVTQTPTSTSTVTATQDFTPTNTPTTTLTSTPAVCEPVATLTKNSNCRKGPGTVYDVFTSYFSGEVMPVEGRVADSSWFWVAAPDPAGAHCWISAANVDVSGDAECVQVLVPPPTPTPIPIDTTPPPAPNLISPKQGAELSCNKLVDLVWSSVSDPSGIAEYQWILDAYEEGEGYYRVDSGSTTGTTASANLGAGCETYRWTVRAVDGADNEGNFAPYNEFYNYFVVN